MLEYVNYEVSIELRDWRGMSGHKVHFTSAVYTCRMELDRESDPEPTVQLCGLFILTRHKRYIGVFDVLGIHSPFQEPVCAPASCDLPYNIHDPSII